MDGYTDSNGTRWALSMVHGAWERERAAEAIERRDGTAFGVALYNSPAYIALTVNRLRLVACGMYEAALIEAYTGCKVSFHGVPAADLAGLFEGADRERCMAVGDPLPGAGPFTVYRGVAGKGNKRRVRGWSWSGSLDVACWFAHRFAEFIGSPAVWTATATAEEIYCYTNELNEDEYIVQPAKPKPVRLTLAEIEAAAERVTRRRQAEREAAAAKATERARAMGP